MRFFDDIVDGSLKKDMGIYNMTDEFFCLLLNHSFIKDNRNILVVVNSLFEANKLYNSLSNYNPDVYLFPMDDF